VRRDEASYVEFVAASQDRLRRIAYAVCADDSRAEDVLQEALVKLYIAEDVWIRPARSPARRRIGPGLRCRRPPWRRHGGLLRLASSARPHACSHGDLIHTSWPRIRERGSEEAFARRVIVNADLDDRRRPWHKRRSRAEDDELESVPAAAGLPAGERLDLLAAVRRLPPMQRRTVVLRHWLGLSVEETAAELAISAGTVKSHSSRGLAALARVLGEECGLPDAAPSR
jgi:RNA polymerase sigma factor (sigma-70 family)